MDRKNLPIKRNRGFEDMEGQGRSLRKQGKFKEGHTVRGGRIVAVSESAEKKNPFDSLSAELIDCIFQFLPRTDLVSRAVLVDKRFHQVSQGETGTLTFQGREAYRNDDFIEAARYFVNVSQQEEVGEAMEVDEIENIDFSNVDDAKDGLAKCLIKMRFLDVPELNKHSNEELLGMSHDALCSLWKDHVEVEMKTICGKNKKELQVDIYNWSHKAATGAWGDDPVSVDERMHCCARLIFLLSYSSDDAVRKDTMLALIRVAREMSGNSDLEKELVRQSVGKVVDFIRQRGGLEAIGGVANIVFETLKRTDAPFLAKEALLDALSSSLDPVREELDGLVAKRANLKNEVREALINSAEVSELKEIEDQLEERASLIAEVDRLEGERGYLTRGLFSIQVEGMNEATVNVQLREAYSRLEDLTAVKQEVLDLIERREGLQRSVFSSLDTEEEVQELSVVDKRLDDLKGERAEIDQLQRDVQRCKDSLKLLKINSELNKLSGPMADVNALRLEKSRLELAISQLDSVQDLNKVDARIATLDAFVQGFIKQASLNLALVELSPDGLQDEGLRRVVVDQLCELCLAHPENEKTFNKIEEFLEYMIQKNIHVSDKACLYFKERLLELEQAHPSPARSQRVNVWLFTIGTSALNFEGEIFVEDDAMNTWLDRITGANGKLMEPFPPARIGRLAEALGSPFITTESRLRIMDLLRPYLEDVVKGDVQNAEALHVLQSFSSSVTRLLKEVATKEGAFDLQRELYDYALQLASLVPEDREAASAVLRSVDSEISDLVRQSLRAEVLKSE